MADEGQRDILQEAGDMRGENGRKVEGKAGQCRESGGGGGARRENSDRGDMGRRGPHKKKEQKGKRRWKPRYKPMGEGDKTEGASNHLTWPIDVCIVL